MPQFQIGGFYPGELTPDSVVGGCISIYENAWPEPKQTIERIEKEVADPDSGVYWTKAETFGNGPFSTQRTNMVLPVSQMATMAESKVCQNMHNQMRMSLLASSIPYARRYGIEEDLFHEDYQLLRYSGGQEYKKHYDGSTDIGRTISALIYLNDDFEGGELEFPNYGITIKPQAGMLILFPSNFAYAHVAHPVRQGTKYALVTWIRDRNNF